MLGGGIFNSPQLSEPTLISGRIYFLVGSYILKGSNLRKFSLEIFSMSGQKNSTISFGNHGLQAHYENIKQMAKDHPSEHLT